MFHAIRHAWTVFRTGPLWFRASPVLEAVLRRWKSIPLLLLLWAGAWYERAFSRFARLLVFVYLIVVFLSAISMRSPATPLFFFLSALWITDFLLGFLFKPRLSAERKFPRRVQSGVSFHFQYRIVNRSAFPCPDLLPDPNVQTPVLRLDNGFRYLSLRPHEACSMEIPYTAVRRGVCFIPQCLMENAFPFNLFKHAQVFGKADTLIVHPAHYELKNLSTSSGSQLQKNSVSTFYKPGESMDFHGCRPYRYGDSRKKIYWRATAKYQHPIVKDFQEEYLSRAAIVLDNRLSRSEAAGRLLRDFFFKVHVRSDESDLAFEGAVSLCASITETLEQRDFQIDLFAAGTDIHRFQTGMKRTASLEILDILATIKQSPHDPFRELNETLVQEIADIGCVFVLLLRFDLYAAAFLESLQALGADVSPILVSEAPASPDLPRSVKIISPKTIFSGVDDIL